MKKSLTTALSLLAVLLFAAWTSQPTAAPSPTPPLALTPTPTPAATPVPARATPVPLGDWDKVVEAARKEGKVVVYTNTIPVPARRPVAEGFQKAYGIKAEMAFHASGPEQAEKIAAEQRARAYVADVTEGGASGTMLLTLKPGGTLLSQ